jgi:hypothetical protein
VQQAQQERAVVVFETMMACNLKPIIAQIKPISIETAQGTWAHMKIMSTFTDAADSDTSVSTIMFNEDGKVVNFVTLNDPRDLEILITTFAP